jgi:hypothetical protein
VVRRKENVVELFVSDILFLVRREENVVELFVSRTATHK